MAHIEGIFVTHVAGERMEAVSFAQLNAHEGIDGDRYALGVGQFQLHPKPGRENVVRDISLISVEDIAEANKALDVPFEPIETRRNILTVGIVLADLVGEDFLLGGVACHGTEICTPCGRPSMLSKKFGLQKLGFQTAFEGFGGIRAQVLGSGPIKIGDEITFE
jgi:MOSC domain-containing protein YiiM